MSFSNVEDIFNQHLPANERAIVKNLFYGRSEE